MRQSFILSACWAGLAAAHGQLYEYVIDGVSYPAFDPAYDHDPKYNVKRIEYGFPKAKGGVGPIERVDNQDIACRWQPLKEASIEAVARAGSDIVFKWHDWFQSHKGPVITYMGLLPESKKIADVEFFKIHEATYDPKTVTWGTDWLMKANQTQKVTIPSDLKAGTYIVRHEIISLHNALNDDFNKRASGAQFYPQCAKVKVIGDGTATPAGAKFPGLYKWDDKGLLINIFYMPNEYNSPGPAVYKPAILSPPKGPPPVVKETGVLTGELGKAYKQMKAKSDARWQGAVHGTDRTHPGGGGCLWAVGADQKTAKCTDMNPTNKKYAGFSQPPQSPIYIDEAHSNRTVVKFGPIIKYLFDPTKPRWEERVKAGENAPGKGAKIN